MTKRLIIAGIIVGAFLAGLIAFNYVLKPAMIKKFIAQNVPPPATVAAEAARSERWVRRINSIGTLVAIQGVDVSAETGGMVSVIQFESGDTVQKDAELVHLDDEVEQADLLDNRATLRQAELEFERQKNLEGRGFAAEARLDEARAKRDSASAAVQRTRALIDQKIVKAPFSGKLGLRKVEIGQYVSAGQALVSLQTLDPIWVDFPIPEKEIAPMKPGQAIEVKVDAFPGETFTGKVETLDARVNQDTRTLTVRGRIDNPEQKLLPGMFANVQVLAGEPRQVVAVPRTAINFSLYGDSVYIVKEQTAGDKASAGEGGNPGGKRLTVERRFVRVGETRDKSAAVEEGLKTGEMVVTTGQLKLKPGAPVQIDDEEPLKAPAEPPKL